MKWTFLPLFLCLITVQSLRAQDSLTKKIIDVPQKYLSEVKRRSDRLNSRITGSSAQLLRRWQKNEEKLKRKLEAIDPSRAASLFAQGPTQLQKYKDEIKGKMSLQSILGESFIDPSLDSMGVSLRFLKNSGIASQKLSGAIGSVEGLKDKLQVTDQIKAYIQQRKELLKTQLATYTKLCGELQRLNKEAYYYAQQIREYKDLLKDKKKAEQKALEILRKIPAYNDFMHQHAELAGLFNIQGTGGNSASLEGLQTRSQVEALIAQRAGSGPNANAVISQQMEAARSKLEELKKKFPGLDNAGEMPAFKPNEMKTKTFLQHLEFGSNIQFQRSNRFFPTTSELAGQIAYKFHKNGSAGLGLSYKLGMGTGLNNIHFSGQGMGVRSFIDWKLKGTFFLNGGYERNYMPAYEGLPVGYGQSWTQSGLVGISKKYKINSKLKGNVMLLFDFLCNTHIPATDPVKLRMGYNF